MKQLRGREDVFENGLVIESLADEVTNPFCNIDPWHRSVASIRGIDPWHLVFRMVRKIFDGRYLVFKGYRRLSSF